MLLSKIEKIGEILLMTSFLVVTVSCMPFCCYLMAKFKNIKIDKTHTCF